VATEVDVDVDGDVDGYMDVDVGEHLSNDIWAGDNIWPNRADTFRANIWWENGGSGRGGLVNGWSH